ncbi:hypothetical protein NE865_04085 [Phthorimaea operculella]|nr:hypothetical protein NE865_04085 [Phthorimaea operculella]
MPRKTRTPKKDTQTSPTNAKNTNAAGTSSTTQTPAKEFHTPLHLEYDSESEARYGINDDFANSMVNKNKRRAYGSPPQVQQDDDRMESFMQEVRGLFSKLSAKEDQRYNDLKISLSEQHKAMKESIEFVTAKYDDAIAQINTLREEKKADERRITALEEKIDHLEKKASSTVLEIRNVPLQISEQRKYEGKEELSTIVKEIGKTVNVEINETDIKDIFRTKSKTTIIAEFSTAPKKEKVLTAIKHFNKGKRTEEKLHTAHLNLAGEKMPIYVAESLTKKTSKLFFNVRKFAKTMNFPCWTSRGTIFLRIDEDKILPIKTENDLEKIMQTA